MPIIQFTGINGSAGSRFEMKRDDNHLPSRLLCKYM